MHNHSFPCSPAGPTLIAEMTAITIIVVICAEGEGWDWRVMLSWRAVCFAR